MKPEFMWNHNRIRQGKLIQMIQVIFCSSLLAIYGRWGGGGAFSRDFTTSLAPECRAFSGALKIEKLKAPLIPGPEGAVDTNDWCITLFLFPFDVIHNNCYFFSRLCICYCIFKIEVAKTSYRLGSKLTKDDIKRNFFYSI